SRIVLVRYQIMDPQTVELLIAQPSSPGRTIPTVSEDWAKYRDIIQRLYLVEDRSLPEVVAVMKTHGLNATERQYKRRIAEWRLDKNVKDDEMRAITALRRSRQQEGKLSVFYVRGRLVDSRKIDRFASRKKIDSKTILGPYVTEGLPPDVRCITPIDRQLSKPLHKAEFQPRPIKAACKTTRQNFSQEN
ncbi:MAG: hypothetical protein Q9205_008141, partial [Flavoplaca limonia]